MKFFFNASGKILLKSEIPAHVFEKSMQCLNTSLENSCEVCDYLNSVNTVSDHFQDFRPDLPIFKNFTEMSGFIGYLNLKLANSRMRFLVAFSKFDDNLYMGSYNTRIPNIGDRNLTSILDLISGLRVYDDCIAEFDAIPGYSQPTVYRWITVTFHDQEYIVFVSKNICEATKYSGFDSRKQLDAWYFREEDDTTIPNIREYLLNQGFVLVQERIINPITNKPIGMVHRLVPKDFLIAKSRQAEYEYRNIFHEFENLDDHTEIRPDDLTFPDLQNINLFGDKIFGRELKFHILADGTVVENTSIREGRASGNTILEKMYPEVGNPNLLNLFTPEDRPGVLKKLSVQFETSPENASIFVCDIESKKYIVQIRVHPCHVSYDCPDLQQYAVQDRIGEVNCYDQTDRAEFVGRFRQMYLLITLADAMLWSISPIEITPKHIIHMKPLSEFPDVSLVFGYVLARTQDIKFHDELLLPTIKEFLIFVKHSPGITEKQLSTKLTPTFLDSGDLASIHCITSRIQPKLNLKTSVTPALDILGNGYSIIESLLPNRNSLKAAFSEVISGSGKFLTADTGTYYERDCCQFDDSACDYEKGENSAVFVQVARWIASRKIPGYRAICRTRKYYPEQHHHEAESVRFEVDTRNADHLFGNNQTFIASSVTALPEPLQPICEIFEARGISFVVIIPVMMPSSDNCCLRCSAPDCNSMTIPGFRKGKSGNGKCVVGLIVFELAQPPTDLELPIRVSMFENLAKLINAIHSRYLSQMERRQRIRDNSDHISKSDSSSAAKQPSAALSKLLELTDDESH